MVGVASRDEQTSENPVVSAVFFGESAIGVGVGGLGMIFERRIMRGGGIGILVLLARSVPVGGGGEAIVKLDLGRHCPCYDVGIWERG